MASIDDIYLTDTFDMPLKHRTTEEVLMTDDKRAMFIRLTNSESPEFKRLKSRYRNEQLRSSKPLTAEKEAARAKLAAVAPAPVAQVTPRAKLNAPQAAAAAMRKAVRRTAARRREALSTRAWRRP
jgi:Fe-S cluster assembly scaffold protein SufB